MADNINIALLQALLKTTQQGQLSWELDKTRGFNCYTSTTANNDNLLVDKYFATGSDNITKACYNLSIFKGEDLKYEIVLCDEVDPDYKQILSLYNEIDSQHNKKMEEEITPYLNTITESLQKAV